MRTPRIPAAAASAAATLVLVSITLLTIAGPAAATPEVAWKPSAVDETLALGEAREVRISLFATEELATVTARLVPELEPFIQVDPERLGPIRPGEPVNLVLRLSAPLSSPPRTVHGTLQLVNDGQPSRVFPRPLPIALGSPRRRPAQ